MIQIPWSGVAFYVGDIGVRWYGIFVTLAITVLIAWIYYRLKKNPVVATDRLWTVALVGIPSGIVFARLVHVVEYWDYYSQLPLINLFGGQGLTIWGAVIGASLGIWIYFRVVKIPAGAFLDIMAPGIVLAQIIGRMGCTANACCYGGPTDLPWGITYTNPDSFGFATLGTPVHPVQVYEIIYLALIFGVLMLLRRWLKPDGTVYLLYLSLYSVWRIGIGFLRQNEIITGGLQAAQIIGIIVLAVVLPVMIWRLWQYRKTPVVVEGDSEAD